MAFISMMSAAWSSETRSFRHAHPVAFSVFSTTKESRWNERMSLALRANAVALILVQRDAPVCGCHAKTRDLGQFTILAEVLVVAAGRRLVPAGLLILSPVAQPRGTFPENPVQMIVSSPAGGGTNSLAPVFAKELSEALGRPFVIDSRVEAAGSSGMGFMAKPTLDDYTLPSGPAHPLTIGLSPACLTTAPSRTSAGAMPSARSG